MGKPRTRPRSRRSEFGLPVTVALEAGAARHHDASSEHTPRARGGASPDPQRCLRPADAARRRSGRAATGCFGGAPRGQKRRRTTMTEEPKGQARGARPRKGKGTEQDE
jgi:hypothetical protein